jgi:hypothetical protein
LNSWNVTPTGQQQHTKLTRRLFTAHNRRDPAITVDFKSWIEVFRKSIPTFRAHAATDSSIPEAQRQVRDAAALLAGTPVPPECKHMLLLPSSNVADTHITQTACPPGASFRMQGIWVCWAQLHTDALPTPPAAVMLQQPTTVRLSCLTTVGESR